MASITLILGGARSGKSAYAERLAQDSGRPRIYLATAQAFDSEMAARIDAHRQRRGDGWMTIEEPVDIAKIIADPAHAPSIMLVDCLTLWLSNLMHHQNDIAHETRRLLDALAYSQAEILLVSSEVGQGIVPDNPLARAFRDEAGLLHQRIAAAADRVLFITAGLPTTLKG